MERCFAGFDKQPMSRFAGGREGREEVCKSEGEVCKSEGEVHKSEGEVYE